MSSVINHKNDLINPGDETSQTINILLVATYEYKQKS